MALPVAYSKYRILDGEEASSASRARPSRSAEALMRSFQFADHAAGILGIALSREAGVLASYGYREVKIWDLRSGVSIASGDFLHPLASAPDSEERFSGLRIRRREEGEASPPATTHVTPFGASLTTLHQVVEDWFVETDSVLSRSKSSLIVGQTKEHYAAFTKKPILSSVDLYSKEGTRPLHSFEVMAGVVEKAAISSTHIAFTQSLMGSQFHNLFLHRTGMPSSQILLKYPPLGTYIHTSFSPDSTLLGAVVDSRVSKERAIHIWRVEDGSHRCSILTKESSSPLNQQVLFDGEDAVLTFFDRKVYRIPLERA